MALDALARRHHGAALVGSGSFDEVAEVISGGKASTLALEGSTKKAQF